MTHPLEEENRRLRSVLGSARKYIVTYGLTDDYRAPVKHNLLAKIKATLRYAAPPASGETYSVGVKKAMDIFDRGLCERRVARDAFISPSAAKLAVAAVLSFAAGHTLVDENRRLKAALRELGDYAASVWFDEATATDEERELMDRSRRALAAEPASEDAETVCLNAIASNEPCQPDDTLMRCTICGFIVNTKYKAEFPKP